MVSPVPSPAIICQSGARLLTAKNTPAASHIKDSRIVTVKDMDKAAVNPNAAKDGAGRLRVAAASTVGDAGFERIKINTVLMRHKNEHELWDIVDFARERDLLLRFIELMPVSTTQVLTEENFLASGEAKKILEYRLGDFIPRPEIRTNGPASYYEVPETGQILGFIGAMTNFHFCETCNKLRLTCEGKLRPCLGSHLEFDMREILRNPDMTDEDVAKFFLEVVDRKPEQHEFRENYQPGRKMIAIGG